MSESRDPAIKLFGKTIPLPPVTAEATASNRAAKRKFQDLHIKEITPESTDKDHEYQESEEKDEPLTPSRAYERLKPCSTDHKDTAAEKDSAEEERQHEAENSQEKMLKKPDKILPCPRCNSMDTKFCYYNNYNVNQPRYFCKNCQRYWTAGGAMRNVPVGAGRRKNKSCVSRYRHLTMSEAYLQAAGSNIPQTIQHSPTQHNETVLSFSTDTPLCESITSAVNHGEKTMKNCQRNESHLMNEKVIPFASVLESNEHSTISSVTPPSSGEEGNRANSHRIPAPIPCFNGSPWPYPWTTAPAYCTSGFSIPVYPPTTYWRYAVPNNWSMPFSPDLSTSPEGTCAKSAPSSLLLGKHSREGDVIRHDSSENRNHDMQNKQERCLWVPKTLQIDNPDDAAKSSIWAMAGIKNDKTNELEGRRTFRAFPPKADMKSIRTEASQAQLTNPVAVSRSVSFQERS